jgi:hypothetical protein
MTLALQLFGIFSGIALIIFALRSIVKRIITERQSLFWLFLGVIVIIFCSFPSLCSVIAEFFGVVYAPSIIFMVALILAGFGLFYCFQKIAKLSGQVRDLGINLTIAQDKIKELENEGIKHHENMEGANALKPQIDEKDTVHN